MQARWIQQERSKKNKTFQKLKLWQLLEIAMVIWDFRTKVWKSLSFKGWFRNFSAFFLCSDSTVLLHILSAIFHVVKSSETFKPSFVPRDVNSPRQMSTALSLIYTILLMVCFAAFLNPKNVTKSLPVAPLPYVKLVRKLSSGKLEKYSNPTGVSKKSCYQ